MRNRPKAVIDMRNGGLLFSHGHRLVNGNRVVQSLLCPYVNAQENLRLRVSFVEIPNFGHAVIMRTVKPQRQAQNLDMFDFELTDEEMAAMSNLDVYLRSGRDPWAFKPIENN